MITLVNVIRLNHITSLQERGRERHWLEWKSTHVSPKFDSQKNKIIKCNAAHRTLKRCPRVHKRITTTMMIAHSGLVKFFLCVVFKNSWLIIYVYTDVFSGADEYLYREMWRAHGCALWCILHVCNHVSMRAKVKAATIVSAYRVLCAMVANAVFDVVQE